MPGHAQGSVRKANIPVEQAYRRPGIANPDHAVAAAEFRGILPAKLSHGNNATIGRSRDASATRSGIRMRQPTLKSGSRSQALLAMLSGPTILPLLIFAWLAATAWVRPLSLPDEGRYVGVALEMLWSGDWLVPTL